MVSLPRRALVLLAGSLVVGLSGGALSGEGAYAHAPDWSWVQGQYGKSRFNFNVVFYDKTGWGYRVFPLEKFKDCRLGDWVRVTGKRITNEATPMVEGWPQSYEVTSVQVMARVEAQPPAGPKPDLPPRGQPAGLGPPFPADFAPEQDPLLKRPGPNAGIGGPPSLPLVLGRGHPRLADDAASAEAIFRAVHGAQDTDYAAYRLEKISISTREFYFFLEADAIPQLKSYGAPRKDNGPPRRVEGLILRPALLQLAWKFPFSPELDTLLGRAALRDLDSFRKAADLLIYFFLASHRDQQSGGLRLSDGNRTEAGRLSERSVSEDAHTLRWAGKFDYEYTVYPPQPAWPDHQRRPTIGIPVLAGGEVVKASARLILTADRKTGRIEVLGEPIGKSVLFAKRHLFTPPALPPEEAALQQAADRLAWDEQFFFAEFPPVRWLPAGRYEHLSGTGALRLPTRIEGREIRLLIAEGEAQARTAIEAELDQIRKRPAHPESRRHTFLPERIARSQSSPLYHLLEVSGKVGTQERTERYLVPRPAFVESAAGSPRVWLQAAYPGPRLCGWLRPEELEFAKRPKALDLVAEQRSPGAGFVLGRAALSTAALFTEAADLVAYLIFREENGFVLSRQIDYPNLAWTGTVAELPCGVGPLGVPTRREDWRFARIRLSFERQSGRLRIERLPGPVEAGARQLPGDAPPPPQGAPAADPLQDPERLTAVLRAALANGSYHDLLCLHSTQGRLDRTLFQSILKRLEGEARQRYEQSAGAEPVERLKWALPFLYAGGDLGAAEIERLIPANFQRPLVNVGAWAGAIARNGNLEGLLLLLNHAQRSKPSMAVTLMEFEYLAGLSATPRQEQFFKLSEAELLERIARNRKLILEKRRELSFDWPAGRFRFGSPPAAVKVAAPPVGRPPPPAASGPPAPSTGRPPAVRPPPPPEEEF